MYEFVRSTFRVCLIFLVISLALVSLASAQKYVQTNLVSDVPGLAATLDPNCTNPPSSDGCALINAWGIDFSPTSPVWIADNGTGLSTLYTGTGSVVPLVVTIPPPAGAEGPSAPTGLVFDGTGEFVVKAHDLSGSAIFIFDTEDGTIAGWNPTVDLHNAVTAVDNSGNGAIYKGLAIGTTENGSFIYATNFHSGWVEMYDSNFKWVKNFTDTDLPHGYAPFGARVLNGKLYVTFALQDEDAEDDVAGPGHGFVDIFDLNGTKLKRLISHGELNSPWGLAIAPANFGKFSGDLLVGNFGNGHINAFNSWTGGARGHMLRPNGHTLEIDGLWGLHFGNDAGAGPSNVLLFTAGPEDESHGLFGTITPK
jgi:uncharacterized protein (TIGR03118 family)